MDAFKARGAVENVCPGWLEIFDCPEVKPLLERALTGILPDIDHLAPSPDRLFEAFRYFPPEETKVVIMGQDPYPKAGDAVGLCFSSRGRPPGSLRNIYRCLKKSGLIPTVPAFSSLKLWAFQGVLMVNAVLTTRVGKTRAHAGTWQPSDGKPAVATILRELDKRVPGIVYLLWGRDARGYVYDRSDGRPSGTAGPVFLQWSHPSPQADTRLPLGSRFEDCRHFARVNELLSEKREPTVEWSTWAPVRVFTDGACAGNGKKTANAKFGVVFTSGPIRSTRIQGVVPAFEIALVGDRLACTGAEQTPTNNRAEYLAVCSALLAHKITESRGKLTIYTDSALVINTLTDWYPKRLAAGTEHELKNLDLIRIAAELIRKIETSIPAEQSEIPPGSASVRFVHVRSHEERPPKDSPEYFKWAGNYTADKLATTATELAVTGSPILRDMFRFAGGSGPV